MKHLLAILILAFASTAWSAVVGDVQLGVKSASGPLVPVWVTKTAGKVIGWDSSGNLTAITITGAGSSAWADITGTPTTLAGYGITDSITAALAASTYQPLIADGTLALTKLATNPLARANHTGTQAWSTLTGTPTTLAGYGITDGITAALAASTYQPHATILDQLSALTDAEGVPVNGGPGVGISGYLGISYGGKGAADVGKLPLYSNNGELLASKAIYLFGDSTHITALEAQTGVDATITLPATSGTLALTSQLTVGDLSGFGIGIAAALAANVGSAGAPVLYNGDAGTPSAIVLTNASGTASLLIAGYATAARGLQCSSTTVNVLSAAAPSVGQVLRATSSTAATWQSLPVALVIACSDETTALTAGTAKVTFRMPHAMTLTSVRLSVNTAPTGSVIVVDVKEAGTTIFTTKPQIPTSAFTSVGGAVPGVLSDTSLADDAEITINLDQIGSTIAGKGLKVTLVGTR